MKLSDFELDVMQLFWAQSPQCAPEIHKLITKEKDVVYTTVKTIIDRLEEKDALKRVRQEGRTIYYAPRVTRNAVSRAMLPPFLKRVFGGNSAELVTQLIKTNKLKAGEIEYLESFLKERKAKKTKKK